MTPTDILGPGPDAITRYITDTYPETGDLADPDFTERDKLLPHPLDAKQRWLAILNPSQRSFDEIVKPVLAETHERVAAQHRRSD
jgi:hypothetical protein